MATKTDIGFILIRLADAYGAETDERSLTLYHQALQDYPRMVLVQAAAELMRKSKWFPRISEMVLQAEKINHDYTQPEYNNIDEAARWYMYRRNMSSTDELTDEDVEKIYASARIPMVEPAKVPPKYQADAPEGW